MLIVMNVIRANDGRNEELEEAFSSHQSKLSEVPGFLGFELLKRDKDDEYAVSTRWKDEESFKSWVGSENFRNSHKHADSSLSTQVDLRKYEVVLSR